MQVFAAAVVLQSFNSFLAELILESRAVHVRLTDQDDNRLVYEFRRRDDLPLPPGEFPLEELMAPAGQ
jgi:hypothetical protein